MTQVNEFGDESISQVNDVGTYGSFGVFGMDGDPDCSVTATSATVLQILTSNNLMSCFRSFPDERDTVLREVTKDQLHNGVPLKHPFFNGCLHEFTRAVKTKLAANLVERFDIEPFSDFSAK